MLQRKNPLKIIVPKIRYGKIISDSSNPYGFTEIVETRQGDGTFYADLGTQCKGGGFTAIAYGRTNDNRKQYDITRSLKRFERVADNHKDITPSRNDRFG